MSDYELAGHTRYYRRRTAVGLLRDMARQVQKREELGESLEYAVMYYDFGDQYVGVTFTSDSSLQDVTIVEES